MGETNAEQRLNLIKEADICLAIKDLATKKPWPDPSVDEITKDVTWLIEQAERAQVMKKEFVDDIDFKRKEVHGLREENKRLREEIEQLEGELKEWADLIEPTLDV